MFNLNNYMHLSPRDPENCFSDKLSLKTYCRGMGALGLPGDLSSQSRFVRVAFVKLNSVSGDSEEESVSQFFHILGSVDQQKGCSDLGNGNFEMTLYTCCCNGDKGIYYYTTYGNHQITARGYAPGGSGRGPINSVSPCTEGADPVPELAPGRRKTFWEPPESEVP